jgi:DnaJ-class molecular chaperone
MEYYTTLEIPKTSTQDDIKKAYRKLAMKYHPDRNGGNEDKFKKIQEAYDILSDPKKRQQYDSPPPQFGFNTNHMDMNDFFNHVFGQASHRKAQQSSKQVLRTTVSISLVDAYNGTQQMMQVQTPTETKLVTINIPAGVATGDSMRYDSILENAVLIVQFVVMQDLRFERRGTDLYSTHTLSVLDLIIGTKFKFQTISGKLLEVKVPPNTQPNSNLRIPESGMPSRTDGHGDQIILIKTFIPDNIHADIIQAITKHQPKN